MGDGLRFSGGSNVNVFCWDLPRVIRRVARIYDDQQLESLVLDWAADCRGLCADDAQLHTASDLLRVRGVAGALAQLLELPRPEIEPLVRRTLLAQPRRESALRLIDEYTRDAHVFDKLQNLRDRSQSA